MSVVHLFLGIHLESSKQFESVETAGTEVQRNTIEERKIQRLFPP